MSDVAVEEKENVPTSVQIIEDYEDSKKFESIRNEVKSCINSLQNNFIRLGYLFDLIVKNKYYEQLGFNNFEEYIKEEYSFSRNTANKLIAIYRKFGKEVNNNYRTIEIKDEYKDYNMSQLVELISVSEDEIKMFEPKMTVKEMRENKTAIKAKQMLEDKLDSSSPRSALSILINDLCNSKSYKYPGIDEPVELKLISIKKCESNYSYYEIKFKLHLNFFSKNISATVYSNGDVSINDIYFRFELKDYIDGLSSNIKKNITEKINSLIKDYHEDLERKNKDADKQAELKRKSLEFFDKYHNFEILRSPLNDYSDIFCPYNFEKIRESIFNICRKNEISKIKFFKDSIQLGEGQLFKDFTDAKCNRYCDLNYKSVITIDCNYNMVFKCSIYDCDIDSNKIIFTKEFWLIDIFNLLILYPCTWFYKISLNTLENIPEKLRSINHQLYFDQDDELKDYEDSYDEDGVEDE